MRRPRHLNRWIAAGGAVVAFVAVAAVIGNANAASRPNAVPGAAKHGKPQRADFLSGPKAGSPIKDQYIVVLKNGGVSAQAVGAAATGIATKYGGTVGNVYSHALRGYSAKMTAAQAQRLAASGEVARVTQDRVLRRDDTQVEPFSWGIDRIDQGSLPRDHAYHFSQTASNVHAYVIDSGIKTNHPEFGGRASFGADFVDGTFQDCDGHGTHVAGTIGGTDVGVAKGVQLVAVRVLDCLGSGSEAGVLAGIDWVTANAIKPAVANMSIGSPVVSGDTTIEDAVRRSIASGVSYAVAAGNSNSDACDNVPSDVAETIAVGATDHADFRAGFSNFGSCVAVFAPGVDIISAFKDLPPETNTYVFASGTSMASPHVAGAAALLLAANPTWTPAQVRAAIVSNATNGAVHYGGTASPDKLLNTNGAAGQTTPVDLLALADDQYVTAEAGGANPLIANRMASGAWQHLDQVDAGGGMVAFKSRANGRYVTAEAGGAAPLIARSTSIGAWEKFTVVTNSDGTISLQANANGKFVTAENGGTQSLIANRNAAGAWEKFYRFRPAGVVNLLAVVNFGFVTAEAAGTKPLIANRPEAGAWEEFEQIDLGDGTIALRSHANGRFVTAEAGGAAPLIARGATIGAWEKFTPVYNNKGWGLKSVANSQYVTAENAGNSPLIARSPTLDLWQLFLRF